MSFYAEPVVLLRTVAFAALCACLIWKICRECGVEALQGRLRALDSEVFEFVRSGQVAPGDPAYGMLRESIRRVIQFAHRISLTRYLATTLSGPAAARFAKADSWERTWEDALSQVGSEELRRRLKDLRERLLMEVSGQIALGAVPLGSKLFCDALLPIVPNEIRLAAIRRARIVEALATSTERPSGPAWTG